MSSIVGNEPRELLSVKTFVGDTLAAYRQRNALDDRDLFEGLGDTGSHFLIARNEHPDDPTGIALTYENEACSVTFPAGRQVAFGYDAGVIASLTLTMPLEPMPWERAVKEAQALARNLDAAGFTSVKRAQNLSPEQFLDKGANKWALVGRWTVCGQPEVDVHLTLKHLNPGTSATFTPPAVLGEGLPDTSPDLFLLQASLSGEASGLSGELWALRKARRAAVHDDENKALPLEPWLEDPDWRPEGWRGTYVP